jgi:hypothetical protein
VYKELRHSSLFQHDSRLCLKKKKKEKKRGEKNGGKDGSREKTDSIFLKIASKYIGYARIIIH